MIGNTIFLIVVWSGAIFMANRLYVIIKYREINIKGAAYSKEKTPIMYWVEMVLIISMMILIGGIAVLMSLYYAGLIA